MCLILTSVCWFGCMLITSTKASYKTKTFSVRSASTNCEPTYMCPSFCLKMKGDCYTCECSKPMKSFIGKASTNLQQQYQTPVFQTGNQFTNLKNGDTSGISLNAHGDQPMNGNSMTGYSSWPEGGSDAGSPKWIGQSNAQTQGQKSPLTNMHNNFPMGMSGGRGHMLGNNGNKDKQDGNIGVYNQNHFAPMMTSYLLPDFKEFYRPVSSYMPGRCDHLTSKCPSNCWKIDGFTGCMKCACPEIGIAPTTKPIMTPAQTTGNTQTSPLASSTTPSAESHEKETTRMYATSNSGDNAATQQTSRYLTTTTPPTSTIGSSSNTANRRPSSNKTVVQSSTTAIPTSTATHKASTDYTLITEVSTASRVDNITFKTMILQGLQNGDWKNVEDLLNILNASDNKTVISEPDSQLYLPTQATGISESTKKMESVVDTYSNLTTTGTSIHRRRCPVVECTGVCKVQFDSISGCDACDCSSAKEVVNLTDSTYFKECEQIDEECEDDCITLDDRACPVCHCDAPKGPRKDGEEDIKCLPISTECSAECVAFDTSFCAICTCTLTMAGKDYQNEFFALLNGNNNHAPKKIVQTISKGNEVCKPLDLTCPSGCETFDAATFCPICNCSE